jgi:outer membrane PBP1 activator LpoA protein
MSSFTPGPWRIDETAHHDCGYGRSSNTIVGKNGEPVVLFDPSDGEYAEALDPRSADALLIAAAPELLEALKEMLAYSGIIEERDTNYATNKARAAIKKATGKECDGF